jgi:hypothetical protein
VFFSFPNTPFPAFPQGEGVNFEMALDPPSRPGGIRKGVVFDQRTECKMCKKLVIKYHAKQAHKGYSKVHKGL